MMNILQKVKNKGIVGILHKIICYIINALNHMAYTFYLKDDIDSNLIVFESEGDMSDNSFALFDYLTKNNLLKGYRVVWLINGKKEVYENQYQNISFFNKFPERFDIKRARVLATARYYIYDHSNVYDNLKKRHGFKIIYITHGCGYKKPTNNEKYKNKADEIYYTGKQFLHSVKVFCYCEESVMFDIGYPRNDYLLSEIVDVQKQFSYKYHFTDFKKIALWMPTFRKSKNNNLSEDYFSSATGLPILETEKALKKFDELLRNENILCIVKPHHLQAEMPAFCTPFSNIIILSDEILSDNKIQLYQMVRLTDFLITDYSSIGNDYMLMNRPIIYTLDDYEKYKKSRGFSIDDPAQYFIGEHVIEINSFFNAVIEAGNGVDKYKQERNSLLPMIHTYQDGFSSERIARRLGFL